MNPKLPLLGVSGMQVICPSTPKRKNIRTIHEGFGVDCEIKNMIQIFGNDWNKFAKFVKGDTVLHLGGPKHIANPID